MAEEDKKSEFKWRRTKDSIPEVYGNLFHATWTLVDVRLRVGELVPDPSGDKSFFVDERAAVTFSWPQAKIVARTLTQLVESFESVNGEIKPLNLAPDPSTPPKPDTPEHRIVNTKPASDGGFFGLNAVNRSPAFQRVVFSRLPTDQLRGNLETRFNIEGE